MAASAESHPTTVLLSFCSKQHIGVWSLTSSLLPSCVSADSYEVYVPDEDYAEFERLTPSGFKVRRDSDLDLRFDPMLLQALTGAENLGRLHWYRQQFLKLAAIRDQKADRIIVWDSDCVPARPIDFFTAQGSPVYIRAGENRKDYFDLTRKLFNEGRQVDWSFIAPGFPIPRYWSSQFFSDIERSGSGKNWWEVLIDNIDFSSGAGFSEYETIGTWAATKFPGQLKSRSISWERFGRSRFGDAKHLSTTKFLKIARKRDLDVVSFENWDSLRLERLAKKLKSILARLRRLT